MATRQVPVAAFPFPAMVNETGTRQTPASGSAMVNETVTVTPPTTPGVATQVFVAT